MAFTKHASDGPLPLESIEDEVRHHAGRIGAELRGPLPRAGAHTHASRKAISRAVGSYYAALSGTARVSPGAHQTGRFRRLRAWAETWPQVDALLSAQIPPRRQVLYPVFRADQGAFAAQMQMSDVAAGILHAVLNPSAQSAATRAQGAYADIALPFSSFFAHLHAACRVLLAMGRTTGTRFLDVGCGGGMKVLTAARYFGQATGLEFDTGYVAAARDLLARAAPGNADVIETNALTFDGYGAYDVIYFYRPMRHPEVLARLERQIAESARPGTLLIAPYDMFRPNARQLGCAQIDGQLYITGRSAAEAEALRSLAEYTGPAIAPPPPDLPEVWTPILEASRLRGFAP